MVCYMTRHQAINWTNVNLPSVLSRGIYLRAILQDMLKVSIIDMSLKITNLKLQPHLPGTS